MKFRHARSQPALAAAWRSPSPPAAAMTSPPAQTSRGIEPEEPDEFEAGTTMAELAEAGAITVGTKFDQPGFGLQNLDGELEGFDVEVAKIIAAELGIAAEDIEWFETPRPSARRRSRTATSTWSSRRTRSTRSAPSASRSPGRTTPPGQQIMVMSDNDEITGPEAFTDNPELKVCSVTGSTPSENIREYLASEDQLVLFEDYSQCADALSNGQVDAVTTDNVILLGFASESDGEFKLVGEQFTEEPYGIGVTEGRCRVLRVHQRDPRRTTRRRTSRPGRQRPARSRERRHRSCRAPNECV